MSSNFESILDILKTILNMDIKRIISLLIIFILFGVTFLTFTNFYLEIKKDKFKIEEIYKNQQKILDELNENKDSKHLFLKQFNVESIQSSDKIHEFVVAMQLKTDVDWVVLLGIHNGTLAGTFHLKRISIIDEKSSKNVTPLYKEMQNLPLPLFAPQMSNYWGNREVIISRKKEDIDKSSSVYKELERNGIYYEIFKPLYLKEFNIPFSILAIYLTEESYKKLTTAEINKIERDVKTYSELIEYEFQRLYDRQTNN